MHVAGRGLAAAYTLAALAVLAASIGAAYSLWASRLSVSISVQTGSWSNNVAAVAGGLCPACINVTDAAIMIDAHNDRITITVETGEPGTPFCLEAVLRLINTRCLTAQACTPVVLLEPRLETTDGMTVENQMATTWSSASPDCSSCSLPSPHSRVQGTVIEGMVGPRLVIRLRGVTGPDGVYQARIWLPAVAASR